MLRSRCILHRTGSVHEQFWVGVSSLGLRFGLRFPVYRTCWMASEETNHDRRYMGLLRHQKCKCTFLNYYDCGSVVWVNSWSIEAMIRASPLPNLLNETSCKNEKDEQPSMWEPRIPFIGVPACALNSWDEFSGIYRPSSFAFKVFHC